MNSADPKAINGHIQFQGSAKIMVNDMISINGLGRRFSNNVVISGVTHKVKERNWLTTVNVGYSH